MKNNAPEHVVIAGLLHDVVEDEDYILSDIRHEFGDEVATLVDGAFEPEEQINAEGGKSKTWPERKAHTIYFIKNAGRDMKLLSCADKLANIRDIIRDYDRLGDGVWDIFNASKDSVAWYYTSMLDAFGNGDEGIRDMPAFKEFEKCVGEMFGDG
jgi:HD domain